MNLGQKTKQQRKRKNKDRTLYQIEIGLEYGKRMEEEGKIRHEVTRSTYDDVWVGILENKFEIKP